MRRFGVILVLIALLSPVGAREDPLLCVLCQHYDLVCTYRLDSASGSLTAAAPPFSIQAPHDAAWLPSRRLLYLAAEFKGRPCIVTCTVAADGAMRRLGDPIPTADRGPQLFLGPDARFLYAWTGAHLQVFPLHETSGAPQEPLPLSPGFQAIALSGHRAYTLQNGRVEMRTLEAGGAVSPPALSLDAGFGACHLALDPACRQLFVLTLEDFDQHLRVFELGAEGRPAPSAQRPRTLREAQKMIRVTDRNAYVVNASSSISTYRTVDGVLQPLGRPSRGPDGATDLLLTDRFIYAVGTNDPSMWTYRVHPKDGSLRAIKPLILPGQAAGTRLLLLAP